MAKPLIARLVAADAVELVANFRVSIINGPRQSGKTTLLRQLQADYGGTYISLDDAAMLQAVRADPVSFVGQPKPLMIDEVQRGGDELVLAIKSHVDRYPDPSQFVLAGSTRFLSTPSLSESLAGRAAILNIWPFAEQELAGVSPSFIDLAFENSDLLRELSPSTVSRSEYFTRIYRGGYPEAMVLSSARLRESWYETYLQSVVEADMREMTRIGEPSNLLSMMRILASNTSQEANVLKIADALQLHRHTATRYLSLLESVFLLHQVPAWSRNLLARVVRRPKLHLTDTGLAAYLLGVDQIGLSRPIAPARGPLVET
ncbi:MAG: ATP-binding protein, partial [Candidatus Dormibacteraceae bacterium]